MRFQIGDVVTYSDMMNPATDYKVINHSGSEHGLVECEGGNFIFSDCLQVGWRLAKTEKVMPVSGEMSHPARWGRCVICGGTTSQPPVCADLRCELELEKQP